MGHKLTDLDALLSPSAPTPVQHGMDALDAVLGSEIKPAPAEEPKGKAKLNGENQTLTAANARLTMFVRVFAGVSAGMLLVIGALILYIRGTDARKFREAFEVLAYREGRTLQANAIVLAEYGSKLSVIRDKVAKLPSITEEERTIRLRALTSTLDSSDNLKEGFVKLMKDNERERGKGASFEYIDPFLKRPIKFDQELGGEISLDKLRDEVKAAAKMDEAMKELETAFLDPIPLAEQMRAEAKRQNAPMMGPNGPVNRDEPPAATPLQKLPVPGVN